MFTCFRPLQYISVALVFAPGMLSSSSVCAEHAFPIDFQQQPAGPVFSLENVSSWEEFKRIKRGEASLDDEQSPEQRQAKPVAPAPATPPPKAAQPQAPAAQVTPRQPPAAPVHTPLPQRAKPTPVAGTTNSKRPVPPKPDPALIRAPLKPTETGNWWAFYAGTMNVKANRYYDPHDINFKWAYSRKNPLPADPRIVVFMHGSGGAEGAMGVYGPSTKGDIEIRAQDAEGYNQDWREWWTFGADGQPYPGRRIAAALRFVTDRYQIDVTDRGLVLEGPSMGGAGAVIQTMILPDPWRENIAYSSARAGVIMPRRIAERAPGQYASLPPDNGQNKALWDSIDFSIQAAKDPVVRGIHYRHAFSSDDPFSAGPDGNTQLEFVNLVEQHKIGGAFAWVKGDHGTYEQGVNMPDLAEFENAKQDVTLDRAHPAITASTGNFPLTAAERIDEVKHPRGHYNLGITWNHAGIVDDGSQLVFPLKYKARKNIGKGVPDQPQKITVSVTPRRPRNFSIRDGETLQWSWGNGALKGSAQVVGDTVTIQSLPLVSGEGYKKLRIYR